MATTKAAKYTPNKQQQEIVAAGDTLIVPTYGLPVDLVITTTGTVTAMAVKRYPSLSADVVSSTPITVAAGGVEDPQGYITAAQSITSAAAKDLPLGAGQDGWSIKPTGAAVTVTWTLRRTKVEDPLFQP